MITIKKAENINLSNQLGKWVFYDYDGLWVFRFTGCYDEACIQARSVYSREKRTNYGQIIVDNG